MIFIKVCRQSLGIIFISAIEYYNRTYLKSSKSLSKEQLIEIIKAQADLISKEIGLAKNYKAEIVKHIF